MPCRRPAKPLRSLLRSRLFSAQALAMPGNATNVSGFWLGESDLSVHSRQLTSSSKSEDSLTLKGCLSPQTSPHIPWACTKSHPVSCLVRLVHPEGT